MGERVVRQGSLFYGFDLDDHMPADHLLRSIDRFVELSIIRRQLAPYYSAIGRPSIDPELMIRMLLIGYCCGIRYERRLCEKVHLNLAYRWFCRLALTDQVPDHSAFSKNRHGRFRDSELLRKLFEATVQRCMAEGIVGGQGFAVDASMIRADAHRQKGVASREELDPENTSRTWPCWTTPRSARLPRSRPSSSRQLTRLHGGQQPPVVRPATPIATTI